MTTANNLWVYVNKETGRPVRLENKHLAVFLTRALAREARRMDKVPSGAVLVQYRG